MDSTARVFTESGVGEASREVPSLCSLPHCVLQRVFHRLTPKELCHASAVCRLWRQLNRDVVGEKRWQGHYSSRWPLNDTPSRRWAERYADRVTQSSAFRGRFFHDGLFGHKAGVRSVQLLPQQNLLATGSLDRTVRLWDLEQGMPLCTSRLHEGTVRSLILQRHPVDDALRLISGSDVTVRIWSLPSHTSSLQLQEATKLKGHTGPISSLSAMGDVLFSGSWDCSVCVWKEGETWQLDSRYVYPDWIWAVHAKHRLFVVCCGRKVLVQDIETGAETSSLSEFLTEGHMTCCEMTQDEKLLMTGATDGVVRLHDIRCKHQIVEIAWHGSGVTDLSFEDPWIAAGSLDGTISLVDLEETLHPELRTGARNPSQHRQLQCQSGPVYCLDMSNQWIACGAEQSTVRSHFYDTCGRRDSAFQVRTWDFTKAVAAAKKAEIARSVRKNRKNRSHHLTPLRVEPVQEELEKEENHASEEEEEEEEETASEPLPSCRLQQRHARRRSFWNSFGWGDSTDDSEIIDAFG